MAAPPEAEPQEVASGSPKWELTTPDHPAIESWVRRFSQEKHKSFQAQLDRARHYVVPAQEIFEQAGLPGDLVYVALVESGFSPTAQSPARATGMWQFISSTGKRFGLEQNQWVDERRHPFKAARAAADNLSFLFDTFGSWELALAAYNTGEKGVQGALDQSGLKTFRELSENGYLPAETRDYVPKVLATVKIVRNPGRYGFHFDPRHYTPRYETVSVPGGVKLAWLEKRTGILESTLRDHNPELIRPLTPPNCPDYELCVPIGKGETVLTALAELSLPNEKPAGKSAAVPSSTAPPERTVLASKKPDSGSAITAASEKPRGKEGSRDTGRSTIAAAASSCTVKAGDTFSSLAKRYGCSTTALAALNGIRASEPLKAGQTLKVPVKEPLVVAAAKRENKQKGTAQTKDEKRSARQAQKSCQPIYYPVRRGDTLRSIAERFRISVDKLCAHNELNRSQKPTPGNVLTICTREQESGNTAKRRSN